MNHKGVGAFHFTPSACHQSEVPILPARWRAEGVKKKAVLLSGGRLRNWSGCNALINRESDL